MCIRIPLKNNSYGCIYIRGESKFQWQHSDEKWLEEVQYILAADGTDPACVQ